MHIFLFKNHFDQNFVSFCWVILDYLGSIVYLSCLAFFCKLYMMTVVMQQSEGLKIYTRCTLGIVIWRCKMIYSCKSLQAYSLCVLFNFFTFSKKILTNEAEMLPRLFCCQCAALKQDDVFNLHNWCVFCTCSPFFKNSLTDGVNISLSSIFW